MNRIIALALMIAVVSCSKSTKHKASRLVLDLQQSAVNINQVDSADVVFRKTGTNTTVKKHFTKAANTLTASLELLTQGNWNADIELYTKAVNQQSNQYVLIRSILVKEELSDVLVEGPGATSGNGWLKRHVKASAGNEVVVIVPEEVYDSYFEFRSKATGQLVFSIQREAINNNYVVDQKTWTCTNNCVDAAGRMVDNNIFMPFTQTIMSSPWTKNVMTISVLNDKMESLLEYDRIWN